MTFRSRTTLLGFDKPVWPTLMLGNGPPVWACDVNSADSRVGSRSTVGRPPLIGLIDCSLATRNHRRGWGDVGNLEGPPDPAGLSKACGEVPQQLSTGWHLPA